MMISHSYVNLPEGNIAKDAENLWFPSENDPEIVLLFSKNLIVSLS